MGAGGRQVERVGRPGGRGGGGEVGAGRRGPGKRRVGGRGVRAGTVDGGPDRIGRGSCRRSVLEARDRVVRTLRRDLARPCRSSIGPTGHGRFLRPLHTLIYRTANRSIDPLQVNPPCPRPSFVVKRISAVEKTRILLDCHAAGQMTSAGDRQYNRGVYSRNRMNQLPGHWGGRWCGGDIRCSRGASDRGYALQGPPALPGASTVPYTPLTLPTAFPV